MKKDFKIFYTDTRISLNGSQLKLNDITSFGKIYIEEDYIIKLFGISKKLINQIIFRNKIKNEKDNKVMLIKTIGGNGDKEIIKGITKSRLISINILEDLIGWQNSKIRKDRILKDKKESEKQAFEKELKNH